MKKTLLLLVSFLLLLLSCSDEAQLGGLDSSSHITRATAVKSKTFKFFRCGVNRESPDQHNALSLKVFFATSKPSTGKILSLFSISRYSCLTGDSPDAFGFVSPFQSPEPRDLEFSPEERIMGEIGYEAFDNPKIQESYNFTAAALAHASSSLKGNDPYYDQKINLVTSGTLALDLASEVIEDGQEKIGIDLIEVAKAAVDLVTDFTPGISLAKDFIAITTGINIATMEQIEDVERAITIGAIFVPGFVKGTGKALVKISNALISLSEKTKPTSELANKLVNVIAQSDRSLSNLIESACRLSPCTHKLGEATETFVESVNDIGLTNPNRITQLAATASQGGKDVLTGIKKSESFKRAVRASPSNKPMFYVKPNGEAIPSTGYRYVPSTASYLEELVSSGRIPANPATEQNPYKATYFGFDKFNDPSTASAKFQVPHDASIRVEFDTVSIIDDVRVPNGKWNTDSNYLEPITRDWPEYGVGGAAQAITNSEIRASKIVDLRTGEVLYER